jgi:hypothetical protein
MGPSIAAFILLMLGPIVSGRPVELARLNHSQSNTSSLQIYVGTASVLEPFQDKYQKDQKGEDKRKDEKGSDDTYWIKRKLSFKEEFKYGVEGSLKETVTLPDGMAHEVSTTLSGDLLLETGDKLDEDCGSLPFTLTISKLKFVAATPPEEEERRKQEEEERKKAKAKGREDRERDEKTRGEKDARAEKVEKPEGDEGRKVVLQGLVDEQNSMSITDQKGLRRDDQAIAGLVARMAQGIGTFPDEPVKVGDTWTVADQQSFLGNKKLEYTLKLESLQKVRGGVLYFVTTDTTVPIEIGGAMDDEGEPTKTGMAMKGTLHIIAQGYIDQNGMIKSLVFQTKADVTLDSPEANGQIKLVTDEILKLVRRS